MAAFSKIKIGDVLWDYHSERAGNTTMRRWSNWPVYVRQIDAEKRLALVSWNSNEASWWPARRLEKLRWSKGPERP